ncbi:MAG: OadG family protein [Campylobacterota bacterium]|nr:OadG family protein [Campylobacterota bacterium]
METNLVVEGLKFMLLGMGTVFVFLVILVGVMNLQSILVHKFFPEVDNSLNDDSAQKSPSQARKTAAITAAVMHHKKVKL